MENRKDNDNCLFYDMLQVEMLKKSQNVKTKVGIYQFLIYPNTNHYESSICIFYRNNRNETKIIMEIYLFILQCP